MSKSVQEQRGVEVKMLEGFPRNRGGVAIGNNAAWLCDCDKYDLPLIGNTLSENPVICKGCGKKYKVCPEGGEIRKRVECIRQQRSGSHAEKSKAAKLPPQIIGNIGLFHVCCELSRRGLNVVPTSRNTRSVDVIVGSADFSRHATLQVKTATTDIGTRVASSKPNKSGKGTKEEALQKSRLADFWVFVLLAKEHEHAIQDSAVCEGGDSVVLVAGGTDWWYSPWHPTNGREAATKWDKQKGEAGWKLIVDHLSAPPPHS